MALDCITSLKMSTDPVVLENLIIVENGSGALKDCGATWVYGPDPVGCVKALNRGFQIALRRDPVVIVNISTDILLSRGWLPQMLSEWKAFGDFGALAPYDGPEPQVFKDEFAIVQDSHFWGMVMLSAAAICAVGPMDENLNHCYGDQDYNIRMRQAGYRVARTGNVVVKHGSRATYSAMPEHNSAWETEKAYIIKKHGVAEFEEYVRLHP